MQLSSFLLTLPIILCTQIHSQSDTLNKKTDKELNLIDESNTGFIKIFASINYKDIASLVKGDITADAIAYDGSSTKNFGSGIGYLFKQKNQRKFYELYITSYKTATAPFDQLTKGRVFINENGYQFGLNHSSIFIKAKNDDRFAIYGVNYQYYNYSRDYSFNQNPINNINTKLNSFSLGVSGGLYQRFYKRLYFNWTFLYELLSYDKVKQRRASFKNSYSGFDAFGSIKMNLGFSFRVF